MLRLVPLLALLLFACAKSADVPQDAEAPAETKVVQSELTPEGMAKAMDVPMYPKADAPQGMSSFPQRREDGSVHYSLVLSTSDPAKMVVGWYEKTLGLKAMGNSVVGKTKGGNDVIIGVETEAGRTIIRVKSIKYPASPKGG